VSVLNGCSTPDWVLNGGGFTERRRFINDKVNVRRPWHVWGRWDLQRGEVGVVRAV